MPWIERFAPPCRLTELTYPEAEALRRLNPVVLLPMGSVEAHGPHLPLGTDSFLSESLALRAQEQLHQAELPSLIAPTLSFALTHFASEFAGTVSLSAQVATIQLRGVLLALQQAGFSRVCLVNSHLEPAHIAGIRALVAELKTEQNLTVAFPDQTEKRWARTLSAEYKSGSCHAGSYETSLLLVARPELCRRELARELPTNPSDFLAKVRAGAQTFRQAGGDEAYFGRPAEASAAEGEALLARLTTMVMTTIAETWSLTIPKQADS
jgi:creatinine amidohydrolase